MVKRIRKKNIARKVGYLNEAAIEINKAVKKIKRSFRNDKDIDLHIFRIRREIQKMHRTIMKKLEIEVFDKDFTDIAKNYHKTYRRLKSNNVKSPTKRRKKKDDK